MFAPVRGLRWAGVVLLVLASRPAAAQVQGYPIEPDPAAARGPVQGLPLDPLAPAVPPVVVVPSVTPFNPSVEPPCCLREPADNANRFQLRTRGGCVIEGFPHSLLWEPPMANLREPRFMLLPNTHTNALTDDTLDTSIGTTVGLLRFSPDAAAYRIQLDVFAVATTRISQYDYLVTTDYRGGFPLTFAWGPWHGKLAYEHTSTHLGDETITRTGREAFDYIRDEVTFGLGRWFFRDSLRLYGQAAWAFYFAVPEGDPSPFRFDLGFEWYHRRPTGLWGQPFAAGNVEFNGSSDFQPNVSLQAGWQWRDPDRRLSEMRLFVQYYTGHSIYGQLYQDRENWFGVGVALDY